MGRIARVVKGLFLAACAAAPWACGREPAALASVVYETHTGPVADPYGERFSISRSAIEFRRTGDVGGPVNRGAWAVDLDVAAVDALFEALTDVDCGAIREIVPDDTPEGGGSLLVQLGFDDGSTCAVWYHDGITYEGAGPLVDPVRGFVAGLTLPAEAASTFSEP